MDIYGKEIEFDFDYPVIGDNKPLFIGTIDLSESEIMAKLGTKIPRKLFLFGGESEFPGDPESVATNYNVVELNTITERTESHHLSQCGESTFWQEEGDDTGGIPADMLKKKDCPSLFHHPRWRLSWMSWPTYQERMFFFAQQLHVPKNKFTSNPLTCPVTLYVFVLPVENGRLMVQLMEQPTSIQTAEQHYKLEQAMIDYNENRDNLAVIEKLIKTNSKDFHEYLLEDDPKVSQKTLELLSEHGKTKKIKEQAQKRLK